MTILLLDDERSFKDEREALVALSTDEAITLTDGLAELDELWLDYVLKGSDTTDRFLAHLVSRQKSGNPLRLNTVFIHTSSFSAVELLEDYLEDLNVPQENIHRVQWDESLEVVAQ